MDKSSLTSSLSTPKRAKRRKQTRGFLVMPAISILNGRIVMAHKNKYQRLKIDNVIPKPADFIELLADEHGYSTVFITDINGVTKNNPQIGLIRKISEAAEIWLDAGVRNGDSVIDLFIAGAERVVLGTKTIDALEELEIAHELSENILFGLDYHHNKIVSCNTTLQARDPLAVLNEVTRMGIKKVVFTDLGRIGTTEPLNLRLIKSIVSKRVELYVGGGIKKSQAYDLSKSGVKGVLVELTNIIKEIEA
ncbi:MAG: hypothetical protein KAJ51_03715 [Thermoplasmata archaeon]|nr:hypothetical protein [Thermoplasmata archaeon]